METEKVESSPEGGYGWVCLVSSFVLHFVVIGSTSAFGVYLALYIKQPFLADISLFYLASIGSLRVAVQSLLAVPVGRLLDRFGYPKVCMIGGVIYMLSLVLASFSSSYWHLALTQGVLFGVGTSLSYYPGLSIIQHYFDKKKGMATGIAVSGASFGGFAMSILTSYLITSFGWQEALRYTGIVGGAIIIICGATMKSRLQKSQKGYAIQNGMTSAQGALLLGVLNGSGALGRIGIGFISDYFGQINSLLISLFVATVSIFCMWPFAHVFGSLLAFCLIFGTFVGGFLAGLPSSVVELLGHDDVATNIGFTYMAFFPGGLFGAPIAGALVDATSRLVGGKLSLNYIPSIMFASCTMLVSTVFVVIIRLRKPKGFSALG